MNSTISKYSTKETELKNKITFHKHELIAVGKTLGLNHPLTISQSQKLDKLIYQYQRMIMISNEEDLQNKKNPFF
ncbi:Spo0E family sporulation regulatory protein-aspartic acid phosphatase [Metabacillus litoralis]|uniref:Spo0E family sporulation regulatory protein-aspartic acid phosphatase n=1 Tax=Metabacillus litoralis TaxID=152268 RepID=UPI001CFD39D6|nr:aspartyl-phosphate phosphatase Spo0E family protein [Metabacillus litoralis]